MRRKVLCMCLIRILFPRQNIIIILSASFYWILITCQVTFNHHTWGYPNWLAKDKEKHGWWDNHSLTQFNRSLWERHYIIAIELIWTRKLSNLWTYQMVLWYASVLNWTEKVGRSNRWHGGTQSVSAPKTFIVVDHKTRFMLCNHHFSPDRVQSCPVKGCVERERDSCGN